MIYANAITITWDDGSGNTPTNPLKFILSAGALNAMEAFRQNLPQPFQPASVVGLVQQYLNMYLVVPSLGVQPMAPLPASAPTDIVSAAAAYNAAVQRFIAENSIYPELEAAAPAVSGTHGTPITPVSATATGGVGTGYTFSATGLLDGLSMSSTGEISGTAAAAGTSSYTVTVTDSNQDTATATGTVTIN